MNQFYFSLAALMVAANGIFPFNAKAVRPLATYYYIGSSTQTTANYTNEDNWSTVASVTCSTGTAVVCQVSSTASSIAALVTDIANHSGTEVTYTRSLAVSFRK